MIYADIIPQIKTIIQGIMVDVNGTPQQRFTEIYSKKPKVIKSFPAVVFKLVSIDNEFQNNQQNFRVYHFKLWAIMNIRNGDEDNIFDIALPNMVDSILDAFDKNWKLNSVNGHRVWLDIQMTEAPDEPGENGEIAGEFDINIKISVNN